MQDRPARGEEHNDALQGESDGPQPSDTLTDDGEARNDFWMIAGNGRHHVEPRVKLCVLVEESFPRPLEYIDVVRRTAATLDVSLERRIDDCWNVDGGRGTVGAMSRCHAVHDTE